MAQYIFRFLVGGAVVSVCAVLGDVFKPKSFAGLFGAAPSVALATIGLTIVSDGKLYTATEARSMIAGAAALFVYSFTCSRLLMRHRLHAAFATSACLALWLAVSVGIWLALVK